ncbi:MAG TPA: histidinol-phosphate transaminase [Verrucomicrobiales bacterium]|nr:histidinol-phosphate transaminase [Verrucomicrobiales bacterium]
MANPVKPNPQLASLPVYQPGRPIAEVARELGLDAENVIKVASNENPLGPSPKAMEAMRAAIDELHLYPDGNAFYLKRRLAEKLDLKPANLILGNGSNEIIEFVGHAFMGPGTDVVVSQYCFAIYPIIAHLFGARLITVPAKDFGHDLAAMTRAITPETRVVFVANPNNPTGTLAPRGDVVKFINAVPPHVLIVMDEAYFEFLDQPVDFLPLLRAGENGNLLLMRTFSKIFGLAGLRLGYGISHPELIGALEKVRQPFNINAIAQAGALAALDDEEHLAKTRANNFAGLEFFRLELRKLGIEHVPSHANFILLKAGDGARVFQEMQKRGIITRPMAGYGLPEWLRLSIGTPAENQRCLAALKEVLGT